MTADGTYDFATTTRLSGGTELSTPVPYTGVVVDTVAPTATLSGQAPASAAVSSATSVTATVAGTDVTHYRYKVVAAHPVMNLPDTDRITQPVLQWQPEFLLQLLLLQMDQYPSVSSVETRPVTAVPFLSNQAHLD